MNTDVTFDTTPDNINTYIVDTKNIDVTFDTTPDNIIVNII